MIVDYLTKFKAGQKHNFEEMLADKLSPLLTEKQKKDKIKNILQAMKKDGVIYLVNNMWRLT